MITPGWPVMAIVVLFPWLIFWAVGYFLLRFAPRRKPVLSILLFVDASLFVVVLLKTLVDDPSFLFHTIGAFACGCGWYLAHQRMPPDRGGRGRCAQCGYDLTGNMSGTCPECGTAIGEEARDAEGRGEARES